MQEFDSRVVEYRVEQLEKQNDKIVGTVEKVAENNDKMFTSIELIKQRIGIYLVIGGLIYNTALALALHFLSNDEKYNENDKRMYYESRVQESETIKQLRDEITRLKAGR